MKKRWISACLAALLLCGTAGCTAQQASVQTPSGQDEQSEPAQTEQTTSVEETSQQAPTREQAYQETVQALVNRYGTMTAEKSEAWMMGDMTITGLLDAIAVDVTADGEDELVCVWAVGYDFTMTIYTYADGEVRQDWSQQFTSGGLFNLSMYQAGDAVCWSVSITRHIPADLYTYRDGSCQSARGQEGLTEQQEEFIAAAGLEGGLMGEGAATLEVFRSLLGLPAYTYDDLIFSVVADMELHSAPDLLERWQVKLPKEIVSAQELLGDLEYIGDRSVCKMDAQMATAYANILDSLPGEVANMQDLIYHQEQDPEIKAVLCDFAGDGYPVLAVLYASAGTSGGNLCQLWGYENGKAVNADILYPTRAVTGSMNLGKIGAETVLEIGEYINYSAGSAAWEWGYYQIKNGKISTLHDLYYQEENAAFYADADDTSRLEEARKTAWNAGYRPLLQSYPCYPADSFTHDPSLCDGDIISNCGRMFKITDFDQLVTDEFLPLSENPGSDMTTFDDSYTGFIAGSDVRFASADDRASLKNVLLAYAQVYGKPSYSFVEVSHMFTDEELEALAALYADQLGGEIGEIYQLSDDLYYIVIYLDGKVSGCAAVKRTMQGFRLLSAETEAASEDALHALVQQDQQTSNITLDYNEAGEDKVAYLAEALQNIDGTVVNDAAKGEIAAYIENAITESSVTDVKCRRNAATIDADTIAQSLSQAQTQKETLDQTLDGVTLNKTVKIVLRIVCTGLDEGKPVQVTFDPSMLEALGDAQSIQVMLGDAQHGITVDADALEKLCETHGKLIVQVQQQDGKYVISLLDGEQNPLDKLSESLTFTLPAESETATVLAGYKSGSDNWGGQYDGINHTISFPTPYSGTYEVIENAAEIVDLADCDEQTAAAIRFMVSKGYFSVDDAGNFDPDGTLNRYTFAEALVRMFFALDRSLTTSFTDVSQDSPYYAYVASGEQDDIIEGFEDSTFRGETDVLREQVIALCSRTLADKKEYSYPVDPAPYLTFTDADMIADWARDTTALAVRETLIDGTGALAPQQAITRGEAALMLYRLFMLLYEPPVAEMSFDGFDAGSPVPAIVLTLAGAAALGGAGVVIYRRRKRPAAQQTDSSDPS